MESGAREEVRFEGHFRPLSAVVPSRALVEKVSRAVFSASDEEAQSSEERSSETESYLCRYFRRVFCRVCAPQP